MAATTYILPLATVQALGVPASTVDVLADFEGGTQLVVADVWLDDTVTTPILELSIQNLSGGAEIENLSRTDDAVIFEIADRVYSLDGDGNPWTGNSVHALIDADGIAPLGFALDTAPTAEGTLTFEVPDILYDPDDGTPTVAYSSTGAGSIDAVSRTYTPDAADDTVTIIATITHNSQTSTVESNEVGIDLGADVAITPLVTGGGSGVQGSVPVDSFTLAEAADVIVTLGGRGNFDLVTSVSVNGVSATILTAGVGATGDGGSLTATAQLPAGTYDTVAFTLSSGFVQNIGAQIIELTDGQTVIVTPDPARNDSVQVNENYTIDVPALDGDIILFTLGARGGGGGGVEVFTPFNSVQIADFGTPGTSSGSSSGSLFVASHAVAADGTITLGGTYTGSLATAAYATAIILRNA